MRKYSWLIWLWMTVFLGACGPVYYIPNTQNVPLFQEKGEANVAAVFGDSKGELQAAFAATDHFSVLLNAGVFIPTEDEEGDGGRGQFFEGGAGFYTPIGSQWVFSTHGLVGFGGFKNDFPSTLTANPSTTGKLSGNLLRLGLQPAIGFTAKYFEAGGFGPRGGLELQQCGRLAHLRRRRPSGISHRREKSVFAQARFYATRWQQCLEVANSNGFEPQPHQR